MIYSPRHPKHLKSSFIRKISLYDFLTMPQQEPLKSITVTKPDRAPPRMLTDTCDGIYPVHTGKYLRHVLKDSVERAGLKVTKPW